jgi:2-hydroxy-3-keto-5-methylthiopentenyl-1-phosphate phosphatase
MDQYLDASFATYRGVPELIEWCRRNHILFMINTTGMIGYFQRAFAKNLLPKVPVLSAHPMVRYPEGDADPPHICDLFETMDKGKNTETVIRSLNIPSDKIIIMGDSGGDGPHFKWGAGVNALLIGSMTKASLKKYCVRHNLSIDIQFGISYAAGVGKNLQKEMQINFSDLLPLLRNFLDA